VENVVVALAVLACPVGMGVCMWMMGRGMRKKKPNVASGDSLEDLRAQHELLGERIDQLERNAPKEQERVGS
jgi:hypothetical protein